MNSISVTAHLYIVTLKALIKIVADDIFSLFLFIYLFILFSEKKINLTFHGNRLTIHLKCQVLFFSDNNNKKKKKQKKKRETKSTILMS